MARDMAIMVLLLSSTVLICTCFGACGAIRQTLRKGRTANTYQFDICCIKRNTPFIFLCHAFCLFVSAGCLSGRRMLSMHTILLITVIVFSISSYEWVNKRALSMQLVISDHTSYPDYDAFERRISEYFNNAYFESLCSDETSSTLFLDFVDEKCPEEMSQEYCALSETKKETCDTSCAASKQFNYDLITCCPSEKSCEDGNKISCPYHRCRVELLHELYAWTG